MRSLRTATKSSPWSPQLEEARVQQQRPNAAKNKEREREREREREIKLIRLIWCVKFDMLNYSTDHSRDQPTAEAICFLCLPQCTMCSFQTSVSNQPAFSGGPCTQAVIHKHLIYGPPLATQKSWPTQDTSFPSQMPLYQDPFLRSPGRLSNCWFKNWPPYTEGKETLKKEIEHSKLVGSSSNKQRNLYTRLVLGSCKMSKSLHQSTRMLKVYIEALTRFSHIHSPDGLNNTLLFQGCILENGS